MRHSHLKLVHDPYFDEFIYDIIYSLTPVQRRELNDEYEKVCRSPKKAKAFCRLASLEQKFHLLAQLGIKRATILFRENILPENFKDVLQAYRSKKAAAGLKEMAAQKLYVSTDRELMFLLISMAQSIHHPQYSLSVEWNKLGYKVDQWGRWKKTADNVDFTTANENIEAINKFALLLEHYNRTMESSEHVFRIKETDFRVLNYLFRNRHRYVPRDEIMNYFEGSIGKVIMFHSLKALTDAVLIQGSAKNKKEIMITATGINLIGNVYKRIINSNNF